MDINIYEIVLTETAKEELEEIYSYIAEQLLEKIVANKLMEKIEQNILILEENPYSCREVMVKPHGDIYRKLIVNNYIVLYKIEEERKQVVIHRVLYGKRDYLIVED